MSPNPTPHRAKDGTISWSVRFRLKGRPNPVKETFVLPDDPDGSRALAAAERFAALVEKIGGDAARATRSASDRSRRTMPTLAAWLEAHLVNLAAHATPGTVDDYRRMAARTWLPTLGPLPLDAIDREAVVRWVAAQRQAETDQSRRRRESAARRREKDPSVKVPDPVHYSPKSIANAQRFLSSVLAAAVDAGHIGTNVARGVPLPSDHAAPGMRLVSEGDFARLLGEIPEHYRPLVATLAGTGARWGEVTALRPEDVDLDARPPVARIGRAWKRDAGGGAYIGSPKSRRGVRTVTLPAGLVGELRPLVEAASPGDLIFTTRAGSRVQSQHFTARVWTPARERAGLPGVRIHDLRHSHASWLIAAGVALPVIQRRLGHESITTTVDRYGHLAPDAYAGAAEAADRALSGALPQIEGQPA